MTRMRSNAEQRTLASLLYFVEQQTFKGIGKHYHKQFNQSSAILRLSLGQGGGQCAKAVIAHSNRVMKGFSAQTAKDTGCAIGAGCADGAIGEAATCHSESGKIPIVVWAQIKGSTRRKRNAKSATTLCGNGICALVVTSGFAGDARLLDI